MNSLRKAERDYRSGLIPVHFFNLNDVPQCLTLWQKMMADFLSLQKTIIPEQERKLPPVLVTVLSGALPEFQT